MGRWIFKEINALHFSFPDLRKIRYHFKVIVIKNIKNISSRWLYTLIKRIRNLSNVARIIRYRCCMSTRINYEH
jgi:hypothetical protein